MELVKVKEKVLNYNGNDVLNEWESDICSAFHIDSGLFIDSELFEIMQVKTKEDVITIIDYLINRTK